MRTAQNIAQDPKQVLLNRIYLAKEAYKKLGQKESLRQKFVEAYPEHNNLKGVTKIDNVLQQKQACPDFTEKVEALVKSLKKSS